MALINLGDSPSSASPSVPVARTQKVEIISIQYLRALAALGVVVTHASISLLDKNRALIPFSIGNSGVDIFFVISGFIMYFTTAGQTITPSQFYLRRIIRIFPLYFAASTLAFLIARLAPHLTHTFSPKVPDYLRSIFFIPYNNTMAQAADGLRPLMRPEVGQGWTLNYEVFFYLLFGFCLYLPRRFRLHFLVVLGVLLVLAGVIFQPSGVVLQTYTDSLILEFVFGVVLGYIFVNTTHLSVNRWGGALLLLTGLGLFITQMFIPFNFTRVLSHGLPAAAVVGGALWLERAHGVPKYRLLLLLGEASYSLYLLHIFVLAILRRLWQKYFDVNLLETHATFLVVSVIVTEVVGTLAFLYAERPVTNALTAALKDWGWLRSGTKDKVLLHSGQEQVASGALIKR